MEKNVVQLRSTLCNPMDCYMSGFPILHHIPELAQTHVHRVGDAIQHLILCHPFLLLPSLFPSIRVFLMSRLLASGDQSTGVSASAISPSNEYSGLISFRIDWFDPLVLQGTPKSFSNTTVQFTCCCVRLFATPWTAAHQASLPITNSRSLLKLMSIVSVMPSNHLKLSHSLLLPPSIFPSIRVFSNESALRIRWPKYWSFSISISPSNEHPGLISFRMDWLDLLAVQGTLKGLLQHHSSEASILRRSAFFRAQLSHPSRATGNTIARFKPVELGVTVMCLVGRWEEETRGRTPPPQATAV